MDDSNTALVPNGCAVLFIVEHALDAGTFANLLEGCRRYKYRYPSYSWNLISKLGNNK